MQRSNSPHRKTRRRRRLARCLPALLCLAFSSLQSFAQSGDEPAPPPYAHLTHFGFYASAMGDWNFTAELAPFTNLTWIHVGSGDAPAAGAEHIVERLREAREAGVQAVVALEPYLFSDLAGTRRADADIEAFLVDLRARLENEGLMDTLAMLYPKDEPFREFRRNRDPGFIDEYVTGEVYEDIHADLEHVNARVKLVFPEKPLGVILSGLELHHRFFAIPPSYDWVGFDCYANLFDACEDRSFIQLYGRLLAHMTPEQRLMAVPEAWATDGETSQAYFPDRLTERLRLHYEMALSEPRFVAFIPFLWSFEAEDDTPGIGLDRFPEVFDTAERATGSMFVEQITAIGREIKHGDWRYPNLALWETEAEARPGGEAFGEIVDISAGGLVTARALDTALPHKNLRVRLALLGTRGETLYKTRMLRTGDRETIVVPDRPSDGLLLGTHRLRLQLPPELLERHAGQRLVVVLLSFADGPGAPQVGEHRRAYVPGN